MKVQQFWSATPNMPTQYLFRGHVQREFGTVNLLSRSGLRLGPGSGTGYHIDNDIRMALDPAAMPYWKWPDCFAVGWDRNSLEFSEL